MSDFICLLVATWIFLSEVTCTPFNAEKGAEHSNFLQKDQKPDDCSKSSSSSCAEDSSSEQVMALVPYNVDAIPVLFRTERQFQFLGCTLTIRQDWGNGGVAAVVWDAAIVLGEYLVSHQHCVQGKRVLELGAGTGLAGVVAALAGGKVVLTERGEALNHLGSTLSSNTELEGYDLDVQELDWTHDHSHHANSDSNTSPDYDVILGADIIYIEDTFPDLLRTLVHYAGADTTVYLSCKIRYQRDSRFLTMMKEHFNVSKVHFDSQRDIYIYRAKKITYDKEL